eukprot:scaffold69117_cov67-Phaeocystis_antarctica.AAC.2
MSLAIMRSPKYRNPGRISPFHESSKSGLVDLEPLRSMVRPAWLRVDACLPSVSVGCPTLVIIPSVSGSCAERPRFSASADESCPALTRSRSSPSPDKCAGPSLQGCVRPSLGAAGASLPCNSASAWRIPCKWRQTSSRCTPDSSPFSSSVCSVPLSTSNTSSAGTGCCSSLVVAAAEAGAVVAAAGAGAVNVLTGPLSPATTVPTLLACEMSSDSSATPPVAWFFFQTSAELARSPPSSLVEVAHAPVGALVGKVSAPALSSAKSAPAWSTARSTPAWSTARSAPAWSTARSAPAWSTARSAPAWSSARPASA